MGEYLTIEEAADRLGVEYKTLYRLVRAGDLPAGRIGRIYRIREEDLNSYFERQKQLLGQAATANQAKGGGSLPGDSASRTGLTALEGLTCGACGQDILSELSIGGQCEQCGGKICQACWAIKKVRACGSHAAATAPTGPAERTGGPDRRTGSDQGVAGRAAALEIRPTTLPDRRASTPGSPGAGSAAQLPRETPGQAIARLRAEGKPVVTGPEAALAEANFIRAFAQRLEQVEELPDPLAKGPRTAAGGSRGDGGPVTLRLRQTRVKHAVEVTVRLERSQQRNQPLAFSQVKTLAKQCENASEKEALPGNRVSRFAMKTGGWGRPKASLVLQARYLARPQRLASDGYDIEPVSEAELSSLLNDLVEQARKAGSFHVVLFCSPTGWTDAATRIVSGGDSHSTSFHDRRLAVALCDGRTDTVWLDESDERLRPFWPIVAPAKFAERLARCVEQVRDILLRKNSLSLAEAVKSVGGGSQGSGADLSWVRAAFAEVKRTAPGSFALDELPELGLVISRVSV